MAEDDFFLLNDQSLSVKSILLKHAINGPVLLAFLTDGGSAHREDIVAFEFVVIHVAEAPDVVGEEGVWAIDLVGLPLGWVMKEGPTRSWELSMRSWPKPLRW